MKLAQPSAETRGMAGDVLPRVQGWGIDLAQLTTVPPHAWSHCTS